MAAARIRGARTAVVAFLGDGAMGAGLGVPATTVDGNDAGEVADAAGTLLAEVRDGRGARFLEASTYLLDFHCQPGPEPPEEYRPEVEVRAWRAADPITIAERALSAQHTAQSTLDELRRRAYQEMTAAATHALAEPLPTRTEAERDLTVSEWGVR